MIDLEKTLVLQSKLKYQKELKDLSANELWENGMPIN